MSRIERVNEKSIYINCICGEGYNNPTENFTAEFIEEFGQYRNFTSEPCPNCKMQHVFNMNLTPTPFDDQEVLEMPYFPDGEEAQREKVRQLMWQRRSDLKGKDRTAANAAAREALEKKHGGKPAEEILQEARETLIRNRRPEIPVETYPETPRK